MKPFITLFAATVCFVCSACEPLEEGASGVDQKQASAIADFVDFSWRGQLFNNVCYYAELTIDEQVLYTVGQLNGENSVGRLDQLKVSNITTQEVEGGCLVEYDATLPVAWGDQYERPTAYELILPRDMTSAGVKRFVENYTAGCVDWRSHDVTEDTFWYYYRPRESRCELAESDVVRFEVIATPSENSTEGMYPEYHKVWEDDVLNVVAIFGKAKDGGTNADIGVRGYGLFVKQVVDELQGAEVEVLPAQLPERPGVEHPVATVRGTLADGKAVVVNAFLIEKVTNASQDFWEAYESLTAKADFIVYNGHSGLGQNVRTLARRGAWEAGQYAIVFMNGCDTYAYIDSALLDAHAAVNPDDETGTRYLDIVANAMPSLFRSMPQATMAIMRGLLSYEAPMTYEEILGGIDSYEVALVTGEHDNEFTPETPIP